MNPEGAGNFAGMEAIDVLREAREHHRASPPPPLRPSGIVLIVVGAAIAIASIVLISIGIYRGPAVPPGVLGGTLLRIGFTRRQGTTRTCAFSSSSPYSSWSSLCTS